MKDRLQLRHCEQLFSTKAELEKYVFDNVKFIDGKKALYAEPLVLKYGDIEKPTIVLAIGSYGDGVTDSQNNNYHLIDSTTIEADIDRLFGIVAIQSDNIVKIKEDIITLFKDDSILREHLERVEVSLNNEILRSTEFDAQLRSDLDVTDADLRQEINRSTTIDQINEVYVEDTDTIDMTKLKDTTGTTISSRLKMSGLPTNQLIIKPDTVGGGIYNSIDLSYTSGENNGLLSLIVNGNIYKTINLPLEQFLKSVRYDEIRKELIFVFRVEGKEEETIVISIGDLVDTYTAGDGLKLQDKTFSIKLNTLATEPYIHSDSNGLAIKGVDAAITLSTTTEKNRAEAIEISLKNDIINEIHRASTSENNITSNLHIETDRALLAEGDLLSKINIEKVRAESAEAALNKRVETEQSRAEISEGVLNSKIGDNRSEITLLKSKTDTTNIRLNDEVNRSMTRDGVLDIKIDDETLRAKAKETALQTQSDANTGEIVRLSKELTDEVDRAKTDLNAEINRSTNTDVNLQEQITTIVTGSTANLTSRVTILETGLSGEITRSTNADVSLQEQINAEVLRATTKENATDTNVVKNTADISKLNVDLSTEILRSTEEDAKITGDLKSEVARAVGIEGSISHALTMNTNRISALENNLNVEINRASAGEVNAKDMAITTANQFTVETTTKVRNEADVQIRTTDANIRADMGVQVARLDDRIDNVDLYKIEATSSDPTLNIYTSRDLITKDVTLFGKVNVSPTNKLLETKSDGFAVDLDLTFNDGTLTMTGTNGFIKTVNIAFGGLIQTVTYVNHILIITFLKLDGTTEIINIPLIDLITDWKTNNEKIINGKKVSVQLTKEAVTGELDELYADVKMMETNYTPSNITNNILGKNVDGTLFVDGVTDYIKHNSESLKTVIDNQKSKTVDLEKGIVTHGQFHQDEDALYLYRGANEPIIVTDFKPQYTPLESMWGVTGYNENLKEWVLTLGDVKGDHLYISMEPIINETIRRTIEAMLKNPSMFIPSVDIVPVINETDKTVAFKLADDIVIDLNNI